MNNKYRFRTFIKVLIEAETPLKIGSGNKDITTDATVALDVNDLPYIPGTALTGVLRHALSDEQYEDIFGSSQKRTGSEIIFSDAKMVYEDGMIADGILKEKTEYLKLFADLPIRQHVSINQFGTAVDGGKFDEVIVFAGTRFCFEAELVSQTDGQDTMKKIVSHLSVQHFRLGGGSRKGFGKIKIVHAMIAGLDLTNPADLQSYLAKEADLNSRWDCWRELINPEVTSDQNNGWITRTISLCPEDFFLFASGFGDNEADIIPVTEIQIQWKDKEPIVCNSKNLIPASSVKGEIAHRVAFHYNRLKHRFADDVSDVSSFNEKSEAATALFGSTDKRGNVVFSDVYIDADNKLFNHNSIDEYTGGTLDGHLFTEKVSFAKDCTIKMQISVKESALNADSDIRKALNAAIHDLCDGLLPLGYGSNKGYGTFTGTLNEDF